LVTVFSLGLNPYVNCSIRPSDFGGGTKTLIRERIYTERIPFLHFSERLGGKKKTYIRVRKITPTVERNAPKPDSLEYHLRWRGVKLEIDN